MIEIPVETLVGLIECLFGGLVLLSICIVLRTKSTAGIKDAVSIVTGLFKAIGELFRGSE